VLFRSITFVGVDGVKIIFDDLSTLLFSSRRNDAMVAMADAMGCIMQASIIADLQIGGPAADPAAD
jgi:hypothetical protein